MADGVHGGTSAANGGYLRTARFGRHGVGPMTAAFGAIYCWHRQSATHNPSLPPAFWKPSSLTVRVSKRAIGCCARPAESQPASHVPDPLQLQKGSIRVITAQVSSLSQWLCPNSGNCNDDPALISLFVAAGQLHRQQLPLDLGVLFSDWWRTVFDILYGSRLDIPSQALEAVGLGNLGPNS